jgi:hypothetical protein
MADKERASPSPDLLKEIVAIKKADREELMAMPPDEAQAAVEQILHPRLWRIQDPRQLAWPGDLADDEEGS